MTPEHPHDHSEEWGRILRGEHGLMNMHRFVFSRLPSNPRCKLCRVPFGGMGGRITRLAGLRPWQKNPTICNSCQNWAESHPGGAEIELGLLFADIRGSTRIAERISATEFNALLNRFYRVSTDVLIDHGAWLDKLVGDEVVAFFLPAMTGHDEHYADIALKAARALRTAFGYETAQGPWVPVGIGVHAGRAFVGTVGSGAVTDLTALGDDVNVAARLASAAPAGTIVVSEATFIAGGNAPEGTDRRELDLKGKSSTIPVRFLSA